MKNKKPKILGVVPARIGSTRMRNKMIADIDGKPLIYYTWKQAMKAKKLDAVVVATDSEKIAGPLRKYGADVIMTSSKHKTGSDRVSEAARKFKKFRPDIVINMQGDEPLLPPRSVDQLVDAMVKDETAVMGTIAIPCNDPKKLKDPDVVKTIIDKDKNAIYFSRYPVPYPRTPYKNYYSKLGLFGFRYDFLQKYVKMKQTPLELAESLEQLRAIENGYKIKAPVGNYVRVEVNNSRQFKEAKALIEGKIKKQRRRKS